MLATLKQTHTASPPKKRPLEKDGVENEEPNCSDTIGTQSPTSSKRQNCGSRCDPEQDESLATPTNSPTENPRKAINRTLVHPVAMDTSSPASYPKHVIVPLNSARYHHKDMAERHSGGYYEYHHPHETPPMHGIKSNIVTPLHGYEGARHHYRADYYHAGGYEGYYHAPPGPYVPSEMGPSHHGNVLMQPKRWACDYCCVATFLSFEEASIHEKSCPHRPGVHPTAAISTPELSKGTPPSQPIKPSCGLGALCHAVEELQQTANLENASIARPTKAEEGSPIRPPSLSPRFQQLPWSPKGELRDESCGRGARAANRMLLAMPNDRESLSDRQCFVRSDFVEIFTATEHDVSSRHSKGAQKLHVGQVGIRCIHCAHLRSKDRAERAVCYPSSISRIYQTVADMQRFHFEQCGEIPATTREVYKSLKTTRPRGRGSPQEYWIQSANKLKLVDSEEGIRLQKPKNKKGTTKDDTEVSMAGTESDESMQL